MAYGYSRENGHGVFYRVYRSMRAGMCGAIAEAGALSAYGKLPAALAAALLSLGGAQAAAPVRVVFLPFEDRVRLTEAWDLGVDVPRWFSRTVDTIASSDRALGCVPFDSVQSLLAENRWARRDYLAAGVLQGMAARFDARFVVSGTVEYFRVMKRTLTGDGTLGGSHSVGKAAYGGGSLPLTAGLEAYSAHVRLSVEVYDGLSGALLRSIPFDIDEKTGGLSVWLPFSPENQELLFYYMSRSEFGSPYFQRNVIGAVMKLCSKRLRDDLLALAGQPPPPHVAGAREAPLVQGRILDVSGSDIYLNIGSADGLLLGQVLELMQPVRPVLDDGGDTLGWVEEPVGTATVRWVQAKRFSQATVTATAADPQPGWSVRAKLGGGE